MNSLKLEIKYLKKDEIVNFHGIDFSECKFLKVKIDNIDLNLEPTMVIYPE